MTELSDLWLSTRTSNCLRNAGISKIEDIQKLTDSELLAISNLGKKSLNELRYLTGPSTTSEQIKEYKPLVHCNPSNRNLSIWSRKIDGATFSQIGHEFDLSKQRAAQIYKAVERYRKYCLEKGRKFL